MFFRYGGYTHANNEVELASVQRSYSASQAGSQRMRREVWTLKGEIQAASQAALTTALASLEAAYAKDGGDLTFFLDDGTTPTQHAIVSGQSLGGTRVLSLVYPQGRGAEYATFRTYEIQIEAEFLIAQSNGLVSWQEAITFTGTGGSDWAVTEVLNGPPVIEQVGTHTLCTASQDGSAVGELQYPIPPGPFAPANELGKNRRFTPTAPKLYNGKLVEWGMAWHYDFISTSPLFGLPQPQP